MVRSGDVGGLRVQRLRPGVFEHRAVRQALRRKKGVTHILCGGKLHRRLEVRPIVEQLEVAGDGDVGGQGGGCAAAVMDGSGPAALVPLEFVTTLVGVVWGGL